ncbi:hypothetical protein GGE46_005784 [Rhizobium etli]|uniref:Uncharacterized protein n=1 Tax=Rhizobium etli TaxID=29449 RepID=A0A7W6VFB6_RHIET|nr:hypothetical protein [Rhizobium etli]MBB4538993.1 hypothetical protein [Rhizobium etli]
MEQPNEPRIRKRDDPAITRKIAGNTLNLNETRMVEARKTAEIPSKLTGFLGGFAKRLKLYSVRDVLA